MNTQRKQSLTLLSALLLTAALHAGSANAQTDFQAISLPDIETADANRTTQTFNITRNSVLQPRTDGSVGDAVNLNLELNFTPLTGLGLSAGAWRQEPGSNAPSLIPGLPADGNLLTPRLYIEDSIETALEQPFTVLPGGQAQGLDLSASYVWDSPRFGQFIVSTRASYIYDYRHTEGMQETGLTPVNDLPMLIANPEIKSSLTLTWQIGNHTASAVTHYADSFEELGTMDLEQFNELVGDLTTLDFQYGYSLKAGKQGNAVFSLGVRNVLDKRATEFVAPGTATEPSGRMAYGTIKYQF